VLEEAVCRAAGRGSRIRYVQRILAAQERRCLCLFQAPGPDAVRSVNDIAQFPLARVVAVTSSVPPASSGMPGPGEDHPDAQREPADGPARSRSPTDEPARRENPCGLDLRSPWSRS
jgi:hypothetical protein